ncbi:MAG: hypothetical protein FJ291_30020 [Planctomycetes bacterium]|nr:hypothetical protein [Planctomycetota bacterium]
MRLPCWVVVCCALSGAFVDASAQETWEGPKLKPVARQEVYEFARRPTFARQAGPDGQPLPDRYVVRFAAKGACDAAVAIEDGKGRILRHLVYGVLGPNAPAPLKANSLEQELVWDGKDDAGRYVEGPERCVARVALGLKPTFDKVLAFHPKDFTHGSSPGAIAADAGGVYVLELSARNQLRMFDHDARYVRTLVPFAGDKVNTKELRPLSLGERAGVRMLLNIPYRTTENGRTVPRLGGLGGTEPFVGVWDPQALAAAAGKLVSVTSGYGARHLLRLRTDGTTGGEPIHGALLAKQFGVENGQPHLALSPDGKWVYFTGIDPDGRTTGRSRYLWNAVWRVPWDRGSEIGGTGVPPVTDTGKMPVPPEGPPGRGGVGGTGVPPVTDTGKMPVPPQEARSERGAVLDRDPHVGEKPFVGTIAGGQVSSVGKDDDQFYAPEGLACDAQGRLYVCDSRNDRVQVYAPDGRFVKTIPVPAPQEIGVHHKTGEIYLLSYPAAPIHDGRMSARALGGGAELALRKLGPLDDPRPLIEQKLTVPRVDARMSFTPVFCLDSWASPPRLWMVTSRGQLQIFEEKGKEFVLFQDFAAEVAKAGLIPHMLGPFRGNRLAVDPLRHHLYYLRVASFGPGESPLMRCDPEGIGRFVNVQVAGHWTWEEMDFGLDGFLYLRALRYLARFDPDKFIVSPDGEKVSIPFEAEVPFDYGEPQSTPWTQRKYRGTVQIPALPGANGFDTGFGVAPNGDIVAFVKNYQTYEGILWGRPKNKWVDAWGETMRREMVERGYRPRKLPGRHYEAGELVFRWSARGELLSEDLIPALPMPSCGIASDRDGNLFVGVGANMFVDGKPHAGGCLAKFAPTGGRLYGKGDAVKLDQLPDRPPEFTAYGWGNLWSQNMFWAYPGYDQMHFLGGGGYPCLCATCRFDTDPYGRSFVPKAYQFCVGVLDTNGNPICEIGRFGNPDSPAMKPGDADIGLAHCSFLATDPDRWLYLNDDGNSRVLRIKLAYHAQETVPLKQHQ